MEGRVQGAAIVQLVAGVVDLFVVSWLAATLWFSFGGVASAVVMAVCTLGLCPLPVGSACAAVGLPIALVGLCEVLSGILCLVRPESARPFALFTAGLGVLSIVLVNPVSVVAGVVVFAMLATPAAASSSQG